jgi:hypothetical protein
MSTDDPAAPGRPTGGEAKSAEEQPELRRAI